eukprot:GSChrysophyteH2.ASY1.ANO1.211.1 assembled CDS
MGTDPDLFVHPERISSQLICPICTQVLESPVQTATEHLFCEDELIEWMSRHDTPLCPVTHAELKPDDIRKPSRIILNMLAELERYCPNRSNGCEWQGLNEQVRLHACTCDKRPAGELREEITAKDEKIKQLRARCHKHETALKELRAEHEELALQLTLATRKLKERM